ncbi:FtsB family cell division protein [Desulfomicrobium orale]|uniref:FtsB family cell division protein n=1 Tax=Desulfomicrobium orale TaxID=132132 RepID=UPI001B804DAE|nr:septum formation initiator family protein [Desulfomicrobium orale]
MFKSKKKFSFFILFMVNIFLLYKIFDEKSGLPAYQELQEKIEAVQVKIDEMDMRNRQVSSEIRVLKKDDRYIERLVKRELFYLSDNELMYIMK